jgi:hypothetical protein
MEGGDIDGGRGYRWREGHQWLPLVIINFRQVPAQAFICSPVTYEMKFKPISFLPKDIFHCLPSAMFRFLVSYHS